VKANFAEDETPEKLILLLVIAATQSIQSIRGLDWIVGALFERDVSKLEW
jgi:hypothetical protein